jgi:hypothetical protein
MSRHRDRPSSPLVAVRALLAGLLLTVTGIVLSGRPGTAVPGTAAATVPAPVVFASPPPLTVPLPTAVRVPAAGVESGLVPLGVDASGALTPPSDFSRAGWFTGASAPGEVGPAVIAGHVDSWRGPAVFFRLRALVPGDAIFVDRADNSTVRFTVTQVVRYPKSTFPTAAVYGPTPDPELRLITCGGDFDRAVRSYVDNVVVFARLEP